MLSANFACLIALATIPHVLTDPAYDLKQHFLESSSRRLAYEDVFRTARPEYRNEALPRTLSTVKVACAGDSITYGDGASNRARTAYPSILESLLSASASAQRYIVRNYGVNGATMLKSGDLPYWDRPEFIQLLSQDPNIIVLMLGTNDAKVYQWNATEYEADYCAMVEAFLEQPSDPLVFLGIPPPVYTNYVYQMDASVIDDVLAGRDGLIARIARRYNLPLIDTYVALGGKERLSPELFWDFNQNHARLDGCHPDDKGYAALAQAVFSAVSHLLPGTAGPANNVSGPPKEDPDSEEAPPQSEERLWHTAQAAALAVLQATSHVVLVVASGVLLARCGFIPPPVRSGLAKLCENCFLPALLLARVPQVAQFDRLLHWWSLPVFSVIYVALGTFPPLLLLRLLPAHRQAEVAHVARFAAAAIGFANCTSIPLALTATLVKAYPQLAMGDSIDTAIANGVSYIVVYSVFMNMLRWSVAVKLLAPPTSSDPDTVECSAANMIHDGDATKGETASEGAMSGPGACHAGANHIELQRLVESPETADARNDVSDPYHQTSSRMAITQWLNGALRHVSSASMVIKSGVLSLLIGATPLRHLLIGEGAPLGGSVQPALETIGDAYVPLVLMILGSQLANGPNGTIPLSHMAAISVAKMVIVPAVGLLLVLLVNLAGLLPSDHVFLLVLLLQGCGPSAINLSAISIMHGHMESEMSSLLFYQYILSIITTSVWATVFILVITW
ncbi:hypothetical protein CYMTET_49394 [Cymbomonas tetramitiformis]|uniref:SGNH hydrolase-type esterase domain-containing protein n=1 Tax=Cymbomonas tetramitiformis TaxID=36881 RepID=A0AAE0BQ69_9CHLO|nr:hypothetical protein CYMTET_49394 [Cymbomonas tetramitiformis]